MSADKQSPDLVFVFDSTRLRSHLFFRWISTSPNVQPIYHPYLPAWMFGSEGLFLQMHNCSGMRRKEKEDMAPLYGDDTYADCTERLVEAATRAREGGKLPIANEHWFGVLRHEVVLGLVSGTIADTRQLGSNPTYMPDELFETLMPVILIRHPIHSISSLYRDALMHTEQRPGDDDFDMICSNRPLRILFDYFAATRKALPAVVDGDDVLWRADDLSQKLCGTLRLVSLNETWAPTSQQDIEAMNPFLYKLTKDIHDSHGIVRSVEGKPDIPTIEEAVERWTETYNGAIAEQLKELVERNMPHYTCLVQFKL